VSQYGNALPRPFKRYQAGYVFRGERPQKGRYRQFMQFDADMVGTKNLIADSEIIFMITEIMKELQVSDFVVRVNTRTILNILPQFISFPQNLLKEVLIVLDKAEKISQEELVQELRRLRIAEDGIEKIKQFSNIAAKPQDAIKQLKNFFGDFQDVQAGIAELETISEYLENFGVEDKVIFDMKIIRGFAYYTGPVFETNLLSAPEFGSVVSGGRYDNLVERFTSQSLPAVGVSVGVDRLETALRTIGVLENFVTDKKIVVFSQQPNPYTAQVALELRKNNSAVDVYVGSKNEFRDIFSYAESTQATYVVILGTEEEANRTVSIKNIKTREQKTFEFSDLIKQAINF
jgi:histidyl-tRNA synthetase